LRIVFCSFFEACIMWKVTLSLFLFGTTASEYLNVSIDASSRRRRRCHGGTLNKCLNICATSQGGNGDDKCQADGSTNCAKSRCCEKAQDTCFQKNQYWAACKSSCKAGETDSYDGSRWDCTPLRAQTNPLVKCVKTCQEERGDVSSCVGECLFKSSPGEGPCAKDGTEDCSKSRCCAKAGDTCFTKNAYWAACKSTCKKGEHDSFDKSKWDCEIIDGSGGGQVGKCFGQCKDECRAGPSPTPPAVPSWNTCLGALNYHEDGKVKQAYIIDGVWDTSRGGNVHISENRFHLTMPHGPRLYFGQKCVESPSPDAFLKMNLLGKTLSYNVDLTGVSCACNAALYFVTMPAGVKTKCNDYYCDANAVCGSNCAELDIQEGNSHAWATTAHHAYDAKGCEMHPSVVDYGPGKMIDPTLSYVHVNTAFHAEGNTLIRLETTLSQGDKHVKIVHDSKCGHNLDAIGEDMAKTGMVLTLSNWGSDHKSMDWLDGETCGKQACNHGSFKISHLTITTGLHGPRPDSNLDDVVGELQV